MNTAEQKKIRPIHTLARTGERLLLIGRRRNIPVESDIVTASEINTTLKRKTLNFVQQFRDSVRPFTKDYFYAYKLLAHQTLEDGRATRPNPLRNRHHFSATVEEEGYPPVGQGEVWDSIPDTWRFTHELSFDRKKPRGAPDSSVALDSVNIKLPDTYNKPPVIGITFGPDNISILSLKWNSIHEWSNHDNNLRRPHEPLEIINAFIEKYFYGAGLLGIRQIVGDRKYEFKIGLNLGIHTTDIPNLSLDMEETGVEDPLTVSSYFEFDPNREGQDLLVRKFPTAKDRDQYARTVRINEPSFYSAEQTMPSDEMVKLLHAVLSLIQTHEVKK